MTDRELDFAIAKLKGWTQVKADEWKDEDGSFHFYGPPFYSGSWESAGELIDEVRQDGLVTFKFYPSGAECNMWPNDTVYAETGPRAVVEAYYNLKGIVSDT